MPTPGYVFKDGQPIPDDVDPNQPHQVGTDARQIIARQPHDGSQAAHELHTDTKLQSGLEAPTDSHALALEHEPEIKGAAEQRHFGTEVKDLGWNEHPENIPKKLISGLHNEDLWLLVRRFNRV